MEYNQSEDLELIQKIKDGCNDSFNRLTLKHAKSISKLSRILTEKSSAWNLKQTPSEAKNDVLNLFWTSCLSFSVSKKSSFNTWFTNNFNYHLKTLSTRSKKNSDLIDKYKCDLECQDSYYSPDGGFESSTEFEKVKETIDKMAKMEKNVLIRDILDIRLSNLPQKEKTFKAIGKKLNTTPANAHICYQKFLSKVREHIKNNI